MDHKLLIYVCERTADGKIKDESLFNAARIIQNEGHVISSIVEDGENEKTKSIYFYSKSQKDEVMRVCVENSKEIFLEADGYHLTVKELCDLYYKIKDSRIV